MINTADVLARYPWLAPHDQPQTVMMGDDLDAALSTALYLHLHPAATVVGVYHSYTHIAHGPGLDWERVCNSVWLDLDIYHPACRSLGHHIVRLRSTDRLVGFDNSCNLNLLVNRDHRQFRQKYPLGTVHFLMYLYSLDIPPADNADLLVWLADSSYINGQSHRYDWNVRDWLQQHIPVPSLVESFSRIDTPGFEQAMGAFQQTMDEYGFRRGTGQVRSHHLRLSGYQCQPRGEIGPHMHRLLHFVTDITGWRFAPEQTEGIDTWAVQRTGQRRVAQVADFRVQGLDGFLTENRVFSFVFPNNGSINYTTGIDDD
jgi:hypothetical protein